MIVLRLELHSVITGKITRLGTAYIANDGKGSATRGTYTLELYGKKHRRLGVPRVEVAAWPRKARHPWALVAALLKLAYPPKG